MKTWILPWLIYPLGSRETLENQKECQKEIDLNFKEIVFKKEKDILQYVQGFSFSSSPVKCALQVFNKDCRLIKQFIQYQNHPLSKDLSSQGWKESSSSHLVEISSFLGSSFSFSSKALDLLLGQEFLQKNISIISNSLYCSSQNIIPFHKVSLKIKEEFKYDFLWGKGLFEEKYQKLSFDEKKWDLPKGILALTEKIQKEYELTKDPLKIVKRYGMWVWLNKGFYSQIQIGKRWVAQGKKGKGHVIRFEVESQEGLQDLAISFIRTEDEKDPLKVGDLLLWEP